MLPILDTLTALAKKGTGITALEFRAAVMEAVKDGKLTKEEIDTLEKKREELGLDIDVLDAIRVQAYVSAFQTVSEDKDISEDEWDELEQIQDYVGVADKEIAKTKKELYRLRVLSEIRKGNIPVVDVPQLLLKPNETVYWVEQVTLLMPAETKQQQKHGITVHLSKGHSFHLGITEAHDEKGFLETDSGDLILTDKRIVFKGKKESVALTPGQLIDIECYVSAVRIHANRRPPMLFRYVTAGNHDIVASVLFRAVDDATEKA